MLDPAEIAELVQDFEQQLDQYMQEWEESLESACQVEDEDEDMVDNVFCATGEGGGIDATCSKNGESVGNPPDVLPYSRNTDLPWLKGDDKKEYSRLFTKQQGLYKKIKNGVATDAEIKESGELKDRLNELSKIAKANREAAGDQSETKDTSKTQKSRSKVAKAPAAKESTPVSPYEAYKASVPVTGHISIEGLKKLAWMGGAPLVAKELERQVGDNPKLHIVHPNGVDNAYVESSVTLGGVKISWERGDKDSLHAASQSLASMAMNMYRTKESTRDTEVLMHNTKEIIFTSQPCKWDSYWEATYGISKFQAAATGGSGTITVYRNEAAGVSILAHEMGHNFARSVWGDTTPELGHDYAKAQSVEAPVTEYGAIKPSEDFAEAMGLHMYDRDRFAQRFPHKSKAIKDMLDKAHHDYFGK